MPPPRQAGELDRTIRLMRPGSDQATTGETIEGAGTLVAKVPCSLTALTGRESLAAQQVVADAQYEVWIRWREGIDETLYGVVENGPTLQIGAVLEHGRRQWLQLLCSKQRPA